MPFAEGHLQLVVTCRQHNPIWMKSQNEKRRSELAERVALLPLGSPVQIRTTRGVWAVTLVSKKPEQGTVEIMFGNGEKGLCKHGGIVWPEENSQEKALPAPSKPRIHPMDRSRSNQSSATNVQHVSLQHMMQVGAQQYQTARNNVSNSNPQQQQVQQAFASLTTEQQSAFHQWYMQQFTRQQQQIQDSPERKSLDIGQNYQRDQHKSASPYPSPASTSDLSSIEGDKILPQDQATRLELMIQESYAHYDL